MNINSNWQSMRLINLYNIFNPLTANSLDSSTGNLFGKIVTELLLLMNLPFFNPTTCFNLFFYQLEQNLLLL
jgi:hypothetical protein